MEVTQNQTIQKIWKEILNRAEKKFDANAYSTFFSSCSPFICG